MILENTNPIEIGIEQGRDYVLAVSGGTLTLEYRTSHDAETWVAISGSPFDDGTQKIFTAVSANSKLRLTADTAGMDVQLPLYRG